MNKTSITFAFIAFAVVGCTNENVTRVKNHPTVGNATTYGKALDNRTECKNISWEYVKKETNIDTVEYTCTYDVSSLKTAIRESSKESIKREVSKLDDNYKRSREHALESYAFIEKESAPNNSIIEEEIKKYKDEIDWIKNRRNALKLMAPDDYGREVMGTRYTPGYRQLVTKNLADEVANLDVRQTSIESNGSLKIAGLKAEYSQEVDRRNKYLSIHQKNLMDIDSIKENYYSAIKLLENSATENIENQLSKDLPTLKQRFVFNFPNKNSVVIIGNRVLIDDKEYGFFEGDSNAAGVAFKLSGYEFKKENWDEYLVGKLKISSKEIFNKFPFVCYSGDGICKKINS